jgi:hypothetical protein
MKGDSMTLSPAKVRRFITVADDIIERIAVEPKDLSEHRLAAMFVELNALALAIGVDKFSLPIAEFRYHSPERKPLMFGRDWANEPPVPPAEANGLSLVWRERYNYHVSHLVWRLVTIDDGPLRGLPTKKYFATSTDLTNFAMALREWKRWANGLLNERDEQIAADASSEETKATKTPPATIDTNPEGTDEQPSADDKQKRDALNSLKLCWQQAYAVFCYAVETIEAKPNEVTDQEVYDWLKKHGEWPDSLFDGAEKYTLPSFASWSDYLRRVRRALKESKYKRRAPTTTRSIVRQRDLDSRRDE